jgi:hypothetical protein
MVPHRPSQRRAGMGRVATVLLALALATCGGDSLHMKNSSELAAADDPQVGPVLLGLQDRRLPHPGQILEVVRVE